mmetsp:Transcript_113780/g.328555  ORF Transcript_113780/g.328555 Transcript_113780/m.328555 type:complete len:403 (+) Transcript_113780:2715-3923(+)
MQVGLGPAELVECGLPQLLAGHRLRPTRLRDPLHAHRPVAPRVAHVLRPGGAAAAAALERHRLARGAVAPRAARGLGASGAVPRGALHATRRVPAAQRRGAFLRAEGLGAALPPRERQLRRAVDRLHTTLRGARLHRAPHVRRRFRRRRAVLPHGGPGARDQPLLLRLHVDRGHLRRQRRAESIQARLQRGVCGGAARLLPALCGRFLGDRPVRGRHRRTARCPGPDCCLVDAPSGALLVLLAVAPGDRPRLLAVGGMEELVEREPFPCREVVRVDVLARRGADKADHVAVLAVRCMGRHPRVAERRAPLDFDGRIGRAGGIEGDAPHVVGRAVGGVGLRPDQRARHEAPRDGVGEADRQRGRHRGASGFVLQLDHNLRYRHRLLHEVQLRCLCSAHIDDQL